MRSIDIHSILKNKISQNIIWLFLDKVVRSGLTLIITGIIARKIGAVDFGIWNYAISLVAILSPFASLGIDPIVIKHLVNRIEDSNLILGTTFMIKLIGGILVVLMSFAAALYYKSDETLVIIIVVITSFQYLIQSGDAVDLYFQSRTQSKYSVYARFVAFVFTSAAKLAMVYMGAPLLWFVIVTVLEFLVVVVCQVLLYIYIKHSPLKWTFSMRELKSILKSSYSIVISGITIMLYMRTSQLIIAEYLGYRELGNFTAASKLAEIWYFLPGIICNSFMPSLVKDKSTAQEAYHNKIILLFSVSFWSGLLISAFVVCCAPFLITHLYGEEYLPAVQVLRILAFTSIAVFCGSAFSMFFLVENLQKKLMIFSIMGAIINISLNFALVRYGLNGVALSTLLSQCIIVFVIYGSLRETRKIYYYFWQSILLPLKLVLKARIS